MLVSTCRTVGRSNGLNTPTPFWNPFCSSSTGLHVKFCPLLVLLQDADLWTAVDMAELAALAVKALRADPAASRHARLVLAGVGYGAVLAHEMALQLHRNSDRVHALALFEGLHAVHAPAAVVSWLGEAQREEVCQVAALLYPLVRRAAGAGAPSLDAFAARLASVPDYDGQLDYVASFRPKEVS